MVNIEKAQKAYTYKVTFSYPLSGPQRTYEVTANPVKDGNMEKALAKYDALYDDYKKKYSPTKKISNLIEILIHPNLL